MCEAGEAMIKAVLFDLDGTLLNREISLERFIDHQYERLRKHLSHIPKESYTKRFIELDCNGYVWKDKVYSLMIEEFIMEDVSLEFLLQDYLLEFKNYCVPFPSLISVLKALRKESLFLGMITNGRNPFQVENIDALGIKNYFHTILVSESEGIKKPNPKIFISALQRLGVQPEESIYVGDHLENDVIASKRVGMISVWKRPNRVGDTHPDADFIIHDLAELLSILPLKDRRLPK